MAYVKVSIPKKSTGAGSPGAPTPKEPNVIFININQIQTWPARTANGVLLAADIVLKSGEKAQGIYATPSTIKRGDNTEGDPDAEGFIQTLSFEHPGNTLAIDEFQQNNVAENFIIITRATEEGVAGNRVNGTPTNPMKMQVESQDDKDANKATFTFKSAQRAKFKAAHYHGAMPALADEVDYEETGSGSGSGGSGI